MLSEFNKRCIVILVIVCIIPTVAVSQNTKSGFGDVTVHLNGGADVAYIGDTNTIELYITNDAPLNGLSLGFEFSIQTAYEFDSTHGYVNYVKPEGDAVGAFLSLGFFETANVDNADPDSILIGGASIGTDPLPAGFERLCYTMKVYIPPGETPVAGGFCIDNIFYPPAGTWVFYDVSTYPPTYQLQSNESQNNPDAPPVCFDIVEKPKIVINEILPVPNGSAGAGFGDHEYEWVEIYNAGSSDVDLSDWTISNQDGSIDITLPPWILPPGCFLTLHQAYGTDDDDFDDLDGHYYTNDTTSIFVDSSEECGLYEGFPDASTIVDFVAWTTDSSYTPGTAHMYAVNAGIWTAYDYVDAYDYEHGDCIARYFDGFDRNMTGDWRVIDIYFYILNWPLQPENPIQTYPVNMVVIDESAPTFDWTDFPDADSYQIQVAIDPDFTSLLIYATTLTSSEYTPTSSLSDNDYFYRVKAVVDGEPTDWSAPWLFVINTSSPGPESKNEPDCPHKWQHKDTHLLCLSDCRWRAGRGPVHERRPGCPEYGAHRWDAPHPDQSPELSNCPHCRMYCVRAAIAMMNGYYGGDLSQDRVSYYLNNQWQNFVTGPEGDLGHSVGCFSPDQNNQEKDGLSWALNGANINVVANPTFNQIMDWEDQLNCFMARIPGHMLVVDSYLYFRTGNGSDVEIVLTQDPWSGPMFPYVYRFVFGGIAVNPDWVFRRWGRARIAHAFIQPSTGVTAKMQEASVTTDSDGDGVMDFDENNPRALQCNRNMTDTDLDQVGDKNDIRNYTFHDSYHAGCNNDALTFPDIDGDGLRAEADCDSDNDADFDGGEDINGDGHNPVIAVGDPCLRETCMFKSDDKCITLHTDKDSYALGEPVYIVDIHGSRETHTFHASSVYHYEWGSGCPHYADGTPLRWDDTFTTDAGGHANPKLVMYCWYPGTYYLYSDVLSNHLYSEPDNWDPWDCWECNIDWFHGFHWAIDYMYHNPEVTWPIYEYPTVCYAEPPLKSSDIIRKTSSAKSATVEPKQIDKIQLSKLDEIISDKDCEILSYYGDPYYYWPIPNSYNDDFYNERFSNSTPKACTLVSTKLMFYDAGMVTSDDGVDVIVWDDDGFGFPGTELARVNVPASGISFFPSWTVVDFSPYNLIFSGDFHIGFTTVSPMLDEYALISDDGTAGELRSSLFWYDDEQWHLLADDYGLDVNFVIEAEVCYNVITWSDVYIYLPWWWWCYEFPPPPTIRYFIGVSVPFSLWEYEQVTLPSMPSFVEQTGECSGTVLGEFERDYDVEDSLNALFGDEDTYWVGFSTPDGWQLPDSLISTRVKLAVHPEYGDAFMVSVMMGNTEYGWSPTYYDSITVQTGEPEYICGDADASQFVDIDDVVYLITYLFQAGPEPVPLASGNVDCEGVIDIDDVVYLIYYLFASGPAPCDPDGNGVPDC